ncbi:hypothetical protein Tco_1053854 [Tanacetum coccineum]|uniref:Uncharacterized protein n=1 Tax=Tanacetum coccineum TaxID=301880 RepID=A0ABQ5GWZ2_9ASTR
MYGFKECSSCGALYNREHCCSNVSSVENFVRDPNPISYDETPDSSQQPPRNCSKCRGRFGGVYCRQCTRERCRRNYTDEVCALCCYKVEKSFVNDSNPNSFIDSPNFFDQPPQHQYETYYVENLSQSQSEFEVFSDIEIDPHHFNAESDLIESLLNRDTLIISSPKFDSLLEEFSGELTHNDLIPPGINKADFDPGEDIRLVDSDSIMEEIDLFLTPDDSMPPGITNDDYDSEGDILFLEELLSNDSPSLHENKSFHFDGSIHSPRPPTKTRLDDGITLCPIREFLQKWFAPGFCAFRACGFVLSFTRASILRRDYRNPNLI